jgi:hypothetical protein
MPKIIDISGWREAERWLVLDLAAAVTEYGIEAFIAHLDSLSPEEREDEVCAFDWAMIRWKREREELQKALQARLVTG